MSLSSCSGSMLRYLFIGAHELKHELCLTIGQTVKEMLLQAREETSIRQGGRVGIPGHVSRHLTAKAVGNRKVT